VQNNLCGVTDMSCSNVCDLVLLFCCQSFIANYSQRQYGHSTHSGTLVTLWFHKISRTRSVLQDADTFSGNVHECFYR